MTSPLDDAKLVERLRKIESWGKDGINSSTGQLCGEAADRLSSVLRENERLRVVLAKIARFGDPSVDYAMELAERYGLTADSGVYLARAALDSIKPDEK
jgi:hypothetical protein